MCFTSGLHPEHSTVSGSASAWFHEGQLEFIKENFIVNVIGPMSEYFRYIVWVSALFLQKSTIVRGIMVGRSEEDLLCVRREFRKLTNTSLYSTIQVSLSLSHPL